MTKLEVLSIAKEAMSGKDYVPNTSENGAMYHLFVARLAKAIDAKVVVELGTYIGETSKSIGVACPKADVLTVDVNPDAKRQVEQIEPVVSNVRAVTDDAMHYAKNYTSKPIDLLFIDINHDYSTTLAAYQAWEPMVRTGGIICVDDIHLDHETEQFNAYLAEYNLKLIDIPDVHATGFGVIIKEASENTSSPA